MKKIFLMGLIGLGMLSFTGGKGEVKQKDKDEAYLNKCCRLWTHVTVIGENGSVSTESYCNQYYFTEEECPGSSNGPKPTPSEDTIE